MYVFNLDSAAFLFVPPAPSSTTIKSASANAAPMSVPPSISKLAIAKAPALAPTYVAILEAAIFLLVPPAPSSTITTTGLITGGSLDIDDVLINGTTIGHTDDTDLITVADGLVTVAGEISVTTLDIGGTNVASTAAELNIVDGNTSATSTTLVNADRLVVNDNGTMVQVALSDLKTYLTSAGYSSEDPTALAIALG